MCVTDSSSGVTKVCSMTRRFCEPNISILYKVEQMQQRELFAHKAPEIALEKSALLGH